MADRKISDLTALTTPASGDYVPIVDISEAAAASKNKRVTIQSLFQGIPVNVGIGTSSPGKPLDVRGTGSVNVGSFSNGIQGIDIATTASGGSIQTFDQNQTLDLKTFGTTTNSINFSVGNTERLRIDSSGRVGIGTTTPRGLLSISNNAVGTGVVDSSLHFGFSALDYYGFRIVNSNEPENLAAGLLKFQRGTVSNWIDSVVINNSGNVGIGTSSPTTLLDVNADTVRVRTARTPASATATGATGEICWDANYIYVAVGTNTWKRAALSTW